MDKTMTTDLDNHITGHYGEDQFKGEKIKETPENEFHFALRDTPKGFQITEISIKKTNFGGIRKFSHSFDLWYKKEKFAEGKARAFFTGLNKYYEPPRKLVYIE